MNHSMKQLVLLYQVCIRYHSISSDVPFISGQYTHGEKVFYRLAANYVYYDNSINHKSLLFI